MTTHALSDSVTMLRRNLLHALRYPSMTVGVIGMPIIILSSSSTSSAAR